MFSLSRRSMVSGSSRLAMHRALSTKPAFDKILIANRGEIAVRVINTARQLGIKTVAVYSDADRFTKHVAMADEAVRIGPAESNQSYLVIDNIMSAIKETGAQAVHPGYGFLSENAEFVSTLEQENVAFIGPGAHAIREMGDKIGSKKLAQKAGVNVIPGFLGEVEQEEEILRVAHDIGYPVMVKASAGGGGKGMRVAWNDQELLDGFRLSKLEAASSFGDDRMLIEKFIDNPRHIEIQVLCDGQGTSLYFPERDCSVQRRNQKVLEESPSSFLDEATRRAMGEQAIALADAVQYRSAGTVEFICDSERNFYFLEMNTRLQVEHPVSEMVTGVDIVEHMLDVAAGRRLRLEQADLAIRGHSFESRVYAEDPMRGYLPSIGRLTRYAEPRTADLPAPLAGGTVRTDSGILEGSDISIYYDPMICKLITHAETRDAALDTMSWALDNYVIGGVTNNINLLRDLTAHADFRAGRVTTKFLDEHYADGYHGHQLCERERRELVACAAAIEFRGELRQRTVSGQVPSSPMHEERMMEHAGRYAVLLGADAAHADAELVDVAVGFMPDGQPAYAVTFADGEQLTLASDAPLSSPLFDAAFADAAAGELPRTLQIVERADEGYTLQFLGTKYDVTVRGAAAHELAVHMRAKALPDTANKLICPMPGTVRSFNVAPGDTVAIGDELCVVEAMKMQNVLRAEHDAVVKSICVDAGDTVSVDQVLIEFEADDAE